MLASANPATGMIHLPAEITNVTVAETGEQRNMELTRDALQVAQAFMALPANERESFKREIEQAASRYATNEVDRRRGKMRMVKNTAQPAAD